MVTITTDEKCQIKGLCTDCVFVAAKCAEDDVKECPYFAVESAICEANSNASLADVRADIQELLQMIADIPCICDKIYKDRGLRAPDCPRCNWIEEDIVKKVGEHFS